MVKTHKQTVISSVRLITRYGSANWALADQALVSGVNFLTGILLARFLGLEEFGVFTLVWSGVLMVNGVQLAVIIAPMMSIGPKQPENETPSYYGAVLVQQLIFSALTLVLILLIKLISNEIVPHWQGEQLFIPLAFVAFSFQMQDFIRRYYFTRQMGRSAFINDAISYLGQIGLLLWSVNNLYMDSVRTLWIIGMTSGIAILFGLPSFKGLDFRWNVLIEVLSCNWQYSRWLTVAAIVQWLSGNIFLFAAGTWVELSAVGGMKAAQNIMGVAHILFQGFENFVPVQAAKRVSQNGMQALKNYYWKIIIIGLVGTGGIALVAGILPSYWMKLFYNEKYIVFSDLLQWYALIYLVVYLSLMLRIWMRTLENTRVIFFSYVWMSLVAIIIVYPLIQLFGIRGIMIGILVTNIVMVTSLLLAVPKTMNSYMSSIKVS